jgi:hypothetical protein
MYDTGVRTLSTLHVPVPTALPSDIAAPLTADAGGYVDPHLVVLATLVVFWVIYLGLRLRDVLGADSVGLLDQ